LVFEDCKLSLDNIEEDEQVDEKKKAGSLRPVDFLEIISDFLDDIYIAAQGETGWTLAKQRVGPSFHK